MKRIIVDSLPMRDYFAANAPPPPKGYLANVRSPLEAAHQLSAWAYCYANAMIEMRRFKR